MKIHSATLLGSSPVIALNSVTASPAIPNSSLASASQSAMSETIGDKTLLSAPPALQVTAISPHFTAFEITDAKAGTIHCRDMAVLRERATRLETLGIRLIGVRHGESVANANGGGAILSGRGDSPLSDKGREQAQEAAHQVYQQLGGSQWLRQAARDSDRLPVLIASPLTRAYDTGTALQDLLKKEAERLQLPPLQLSVVKDPDLQEIDFGQCEGQDARKVAQTYPNFGSGIDFLHRFPDGESGMDILARVDRFLDKVEKDYVGRTVVFYGHTMSLGLAKVLLGQGEHDTSGHLKVDRSKLPNATPINLTCPAPLKQELNGWYCS